LAGCFIASDDYNSSISNEVSMNFNVTDIEFDFDDDYANGFDLTFDEEIELRDLTLGVWEADDEDDLIEEITAATGWCIKSIDYDIQLK
jgi:hypothetical protein